MITLTIATLHDAKTLAQIHCDSWRQTYQSLLPESYIAEQADLESKTALWQHVVAHPETITLLAQDSQRDPEHNKVGFISYFIDPTEAAKATITTLYVLPEAQNQGVGKALLTHALERLTAKSVSEVTLWVLKTNDSAIGFYQQYGFLVSGEEKRDYVGDFEIVDIQMIKQLNQ